MSNSSEAETAVPVPAQNVKWKLSLQHYQMVRVCELVFRTIKKNGPTQKYTWFSPKELK